MSFARSAALVLVAVPLALLGCNKDGGSSSGSNDSAPSKPSGPPSNIKAAKGVTNASPVTAVYTTGKAAGSSYWKAKFDVTNNGTKDTKKISFFECSYDANGKATGPTDQMLQSEEGVVVKPKSKGSVEIEFQSSVLGPGYQIALMIHHVTWSDDSKWEETKTHTFCPATLK